LVDWLQALTTGSISGLFTFAALFGANCLLDWKRHLQERPILDINLSDNPTVLEKPIEIPLYDVTKPDLPSHLRKISRYVLRYKVNRIKVSNNGNTAARNCKGMIIQDGVEMNVCWHMPAERYKLTINAKSYEFLDLCGFLLDKPDDMAVELKKNVANLSEQYTMTDNQTRLLESVPAIKHEFLAEYPNESDNSKLIAKYFPYIIAPTETNWQSPPNLNWILKPGHAIVRVTSVNASPIDYDITILKDPKNGKIIRLGSKSK
jgi:hypothetical protein